MRLIAEDASHAGSMITSSASGRTRTDTSLLTMDFESIAATSYATEADDFDYATLSRSQLIRKKLEG